MGNAALASSSFSYTFLTAHCQRKDTGLNHLPWLDFPNFSLQNQNKQLNRGTNMLCLLHSDRCKVSHLRFKTQGLHQRDHFADTLRLFEITACLRTPFSPAPSPSIVNANQLLILPKQNPFHFSSRSCLLHLMWWAVQCACRRLGSIKVINDFLL